MPESQVKRANLGVGVRSRGDGVGWEVRAPSGSRNSCWADFSRGSPALPQGPWEGGRRRNQAGRSRTQLEVTSVSVALHPSDRPVLPSTPDRRNSACLCLCSSQKPASLGEGSRPSPRGPSLGSAEAVHTSSRFWEVRPAQAPSPW